MIGEYGRLPGRLETALGYADRMSVQSNFPFASVKDIIRHERYVGKGQKLTFVQSLVTLL
jgi:hypothetical protein